MRANRKLSGESWEFDGKTITARIIPMTWQRRGSCKVIIGLDGGDAWAPAKPRPNSTLIRALARAHRWKRMLEEGRFRSARELAEAEGVTRSFVNRLLRLTLWEMRLERAGTTGLGIHGLRRNAVRIVENRAKVESRQARGYHFQPQRPGIWDMSFNQGNRGASSPRQDVQLGSEEYHGSHAEGVPRVRSQGQRRRPRRRYYHRRRVRQDRRLAGRRRDHAADRPAPGQGRLQRPLPQPRHRWRRVRLAGGGQGGGRACDRLRHLHQYGDQLRDRRPRRVPPGQAGQPPEALRRRRGSGRAALAADRHVVLLEEIRDILKYRPIVPGKPVE